MLKKKKKKVIILLQMMTQSGRDPGVPGWDTGALEALESSADSPNAVHTHRDRGQLLRNP